LGGDMRAMTIAAVAVGAVLMLGGCGGGTDEVNGGMIGSATPTAAPSTTTTPSATAPATTTATRNGAADTSTTRCTDRTNYAGDPRSNAEIDSLGERTGTCPPVRSARPAAGGVPYDPQVSCTNRGNYAGDPRSNAEINSIGERTGTCPAVQK
ncbi:MAG: hypothetical protein ABW212_10780, partial [Pseudonocardia sediminis]